MNLTKAELLELLKDVPDNAVVFLDCKDEDEMPLALVSTGNIGTMKNYLPGFWTDSEIEKWKRLGLTIDVHGPAVCLRPAKN